MYHELYVTSRKNLFTARDKNKYLCLEQITLDVTAKTNSKINSWEAYQKRIKPKNVEDFHTDEQLVAASLYLSAVEKKKGAILTRDGDIKRILDNTLKYGNLRGISDLIAENSIKVYYLTGQQEAACRFDTSKIIS